MSNATTTRGTIPLSRTNYYSYFDNLPRVIRDAINYTDIVQCPYHARKCLRAGMTPEQVALGILEGVPRELIPVPGPWDGAR